MFDSRYREELKNISGQIRGYLEFYLELGMDSASGGSGTRTEAPSRFLEILRADIGDCTRCKLHPHRTQLVFGSGNPNAQIMFIGEAPGEEEDLQGQPFVGPAGQLLTRILEVMGLGRDEVYIANILKCRPPKNRNPEPDEIATCQPFLRRQVEIIHPKVICALGTFAAQTLLQTDQKISRLRGRFHDYSGVKLMPTYHPAYLLRNPQDKRLVWEDMKMIMKELKSEGLGASAPLSPERSRRASEHPPKAERTGPQKA